MPKFFVKKESIDDHTITLDGDNARHIGNVLRARVGDSITVCDGEGMDYECRISSITKDRVTAEITDISTNGSEPSVSITLYQGLPKADKMELVIQKCIEIGVDGIIPVSTEHSVVKLEGKEDKKLARWNKIAEAAAKQCGRGKIPAVGRVMSFDEAVKHAMSLDSAVIPYERERERGLRQFTDGFKGRSIGVFIGPEGGFSQSEIELARASGIIPVTLGRRILRTETAGLVAAVILLHELEDLM